MRRFAWVLVLLVIAGVGVPLLGSHWLGWGQNPGAVPAASKRVEIGRGRALNVLDLGEGSPIVLVHGFPSSLQDWAEVPEKLAAMGHRVIVYDRVGYGSSSRDGGAPGEYTYASSAHDLLALLDALGLQRVALAGWSYGGAVVQALAVEHPERVSHLALLGSEGPARKRGGDDAVGRIIASGMGEEVLRWAAVIAPVGEAFTQENLKAAFAKESAIPEGWNERTRAMLALPGTLAAVVAEEQRGDPSSLHPEQIRVPAVVLQGTADFLVPLAVGEDLAKRLPAADLLAIPGGSHMLPVTDADLVAGALHALVSEH
jgi:pimeloyl-ACP methyl ester carboxylesterase